MGTLDLLFGGEYFVRVLCFYVLFITVFGFFVLVLVVYSIFSCFAYLFCFVSSIACSCRWCLGLVESIAHRIVFFVYVGESFVSCLCVF